jgi:pimeloyl-ACP methyl ester carboxylesterase
LDGVSHTYRERVVTFGDNRGLVGIITLPTTPRPGTPRVVLLNSGVIHRVGANRLHVGFARALASVGLTTLRFDLSGIGDSDRRTDVGSLSEAVAKDIGAATDVLRKDYAAEKFILVGLCSGAYDAYQTALADDRVIAAVMLDIPGPFFGWRHVMYHIGSRLLRLRTYRNAPRIFLRIVRSLTAQRPPKENGMAPELPQGVRPITPLDVMRAGLDQLLARPVSLYFIFTAGLENNYNHRSQFRHRFPRAASHPRVRVDFLPDCDHTFTTGAARTRITAMVRDWVLREASAAVEPERQAGQSAGAA